MKGSYLLGSSYWQKVRKLREESVGHVCEQCRVRTSGLVGHHVVPREAIHRFAKLADSLLGEGASRGFKDVLVSSETCRIRCRSCEKSLHLAYPPHGNEEDDYRVMIARLEAAFEMLVRLLKEASRTTLESEVFFAAVVPAESFPTHFVH